MSSELEASPQPPPGATGLRMRRPSSGSRPHLLVEPQEDRWRWRRRIRQSPRQLRAYRAVVALAGLVLIALGAATGWLPGPGGIPLVLLGLAVWASEFEWANRLMQRFKRLLKRYLRWSGRQRALFWLLFAAACGLLGYSYLLTFGPPGWFPDLVERGLRHLPGV